MRIRAYLWEALLCQNVLCVPRVLWEHSLCLLCWCCRGSCTSVVVFSHGIHGIHGMLGCVIGGVGMAGCHTLLICAHLCLSVGGTSLPECSVCSACSVGHSLCLLCWCCRGSCTSVVVFSHGIHGIHGIHGMLGCVIGCVGMAGMPYPPNLCVSVPICGRHFSARRFCVFRVFCGTLSLFALLVHLWAAHLRWFPSAARSDCVRHPIRLRPPPDQIPFAVRSGSVRCTMP